MKWFEISYNERIRIQYNIDSILLEENQMIIINNENTNPDIPLNYKR